MLTAAPDHRKTILKEEKYNSTNFQTLWDFEGVFKYSPLFYGWYTSKETKKSIYRMPLAYFITGLVAYAYSFFATLRKMAENSRMSKLSEKDDECIFSWKLFTAWDYMIGNAETAHNRIASIVVGFKEALLEEAEKKRESRNWKITGIRILVNIVVLGLLLFSAFAVILVVKRSTEPEARSSVWRSNEITFVMTFISISFPMIFDGLGFFEQYHPRKQLVLQLTRIMVLNLLNLYSLIFALFDKISHMTPELESFKKRINTSLQPYSAEMQNQTICCDSEMDTLKALSLIAAIATNVSTTLYPIMQKALENSTTTSDNETIDSEFTTSSTFPGYMTSTAFSENYTDNAVTNMENVTFTSSFLTSLGITDAKTASDDYDDYYYDEDVPATSDHSTTRNYPKMIYTTTTLAPTTYSKRQEISTTKLKETTTLKIPEKEIKTDKPPCKKFCQKLYFPYENLTTTGSALIDETGLNYSTRRRLRNLCWETMFGQELIKLTVMDLVMTIVSTLAMDFIRGIFVRVMNRCWCWDLEKRFPQYADFKVAENILHLVNNQGMVWMGMFFSPGLLVLNIGKLFIMMYFRAWIVLTCNVPHEVIFRASRSNNFYYALLLMMLFLCVLPVGYAIVRIPPTGNCGPFSDYKRIFHILTSTIKKNVPGPVQDVIDYIASPGIIIPLLLLLILIIYYLVSLTGALREANNDLKIQLRRERTEERRKMFQIVDKRRKIALGGSGEFSNTPFAKWRSLFKNMPSTGKSFDDTTPSKGINNEGKNEGTKNKDVFSKLIKRALGKPSMSEAENQDTPNQDEGTDTEQHESLPEDLVSYNESKPIQSPGLPLSSGSFDYQKNLLQKRNSQKSISETSNLRESKPKREIRQDSSSSVWSDNIPVITISKTESAEGLDVVPEMKVELPKTEETKFKPKIKCALRKQSTEIDEDVICYFSKDLDLKPTVFGFEEKDGGVSESSEDTARESSTDTVLTVKSEEPTIKENIAEIQTTDNNGMAEISSANGSITESSADYNDITSL